MGRIVRRRDPRSSETADWIRRLIIGSPIYNGLLGSPLKNLFEHVEYKSLEGKVAVYIIKSGSQISALQVQGQLVPLQVDYPTFS